MSLIEVEWRLDSFPAIKQIRVAAAFGMQWLHTAANTATRTSIAMMP
jgi:hypothetical protein